MKGFTKFTGRSARWALPARANETVKAKPQATVPILFLAAGDAGSFKNRFIVTFMRPSSAFRRRH
jgi:hypothetical protein